MFFTEILVFIDLHTSKARIQKRPGILIYKKKKKEEYCGLIKNIINRYTYIQYTVKNAIRCFKSFLDLMPKGSYMI